MFHARLTRDPGEVVHLDHGPAARFGVHAPARLMMLRAFAFSLIIGRYAYPDADILCIGSFGFCDHRRPPAALCTFHYFTARSKRSTRCSGALPIRFAICINYSSSFLTDRATTSATAR